MQRDKGKDIRRETGGGSVILPCSGRGLNEKRPEWQSGSSSSRAASSRVSWDKPEQFKVSRMKTR